MGPTVFFRIFKLSTTTGKHLGDINHARIVSLMCELITSPEDIDDLSIGFEGNRGRSRDELALNKNTEGK